MSLNSNEDAKQQFALTEDLVLVNKFVEIKEEILTALADLLFSGGYVLDTFCAAMLKRENEFPTGLETLFTGVAIPHTDNIHVQQPAIAIATLAKPVSFQAMASPQQTVAVDIIIMLAVHDPGAQVQMLQKIINMLQNKSVLHDLKRAKTPSELVSIINSYFDTEKEVSFDQQAQGR